MGLDWHSRLSNGKRILIALSLLRRIIELTMLLYLLYFAGDQGLGRPSCDFQNKREVLKITAATGREVAKSPISCLIALAATSFRFRPQAVFRTMAALHGLHAYSPIDQCCWVSGDGELRK